MRILWLVIGKSMKRSCLLLLGHQNKRCRSRDGRGSQVKRFHLLAFRLEDFPQRFYTSDLPNHSRVGTTHITSALEFIIHIKLRTRRIWWFPRPIVTCWMLVVMSKAIEDIRRGVYIAKSDSSSSRSSFPSYVKRNAGAKERKVWAYTATRTPIPEISGLAEMHSAPDISST